MKVLIDTSPLNSSHAVRGIGTYTRLLTEHLEQEENIEVVRSETEAARKFKPDLVHYPFFDFFFPTLPILRLKPTAVTVHDVIPLIYPDKYPVGVRGKAALVKQKAALSRAGVVLTDSESSKTDIHQYLGVDLDKIEVVYLAASPELQATSPQEINRVSRKYGLPKSYVLYVGDINYNKNIPQLIKAARYLPRYTKLVCLGKSFYPQEIPEWQWIETQLALSDVANKVKFLTDVPGGAMGDLAAIYSGAECYVQPSIYEGFGLPVLEAMQCMTPVVTAKNSSLIEVAGEHAVFVDDPQAVNFARGIEQVLSWSKKERQKKIRTAYKWSQTFTWKKTAQQTLEAYRRLV